MTTKWSKHALFQTKSISDPNKYTAQHIQQNVFTKFYTCAYCKERRVLDKTVHSHLIECKKQVLEKKLDKTPDNTPETPEKTLTPDVKVVVETPMKIESTELTYFTLDKDDDEVADKIFFESIYSWNIDEKDAEYTALDGFVLIAQKVTDSQKELFLKHKTEEKRDPQDTHLSGTDDPRVLLLTAESIWLNNTSPTEKAVQKSRVGYRPRKRTAVSVRRCRHCFMKLDPKDMLMQTTLHSMYLHGKKGKKWFVSYGSSLSIYGSEKSMLKKLRLLHDERERRMRKSAFKPVGKKKGTPALPSKKNTKLIGKKRKKVVKPTPPRKAVRRRKIGKNVIDLTQPESFEEVEEELSSQIPMSLDLGDFYNTPDDGSNEWPEPIPKDDSMDVTDPEVENLIDEWFN
jgi:hypothetical protein